MVLKINLNQMEEHNIYRFNQYLVVRTKNKSNI